MRAASLGSYTDGMPAVPDAHPPRVAETDPPGGVAPAGPAAPRRACLSVPGSSERMLAKARGLRVDELVLDLEDAVRPQDKVDARARVVAAVDEPGWACGTIAVRVNALDTPWGRDDLIAVGRSGAASVVVPKVAAPEHLAAVDALLGDAEEGTARRAPLAVQALIESAAGVAAVDRVAGASRRLVGLILGYADLAADLGRSPEAARLLDLWLPVQTAVLLAARANGVQAIDGPWLGTAVDDAFAAAAGRAAELGFDGKWAIHPAQVDALRARFTPSAEEVGRARRVLDALHGAEGGAVALDGQMLDEALAVSARRTLVRAGEPA